MPVDASVYNNIQAPPNALQQFGQIQGLQNANLQGQLLQQEIPIRQQQQQQAQLATQQQQMATKQTEDEQASLQDLTNFKNPDGKTYDYNAWLSNTAVNHPLAIKTALGIRDNQATPENFGIATSGPNQGATQQLPTQQVGAALGSGNASPVITGLPAGGSPQTQSRNNYNQVTAEAENTPGSLAAYNEVINMNKAGALTGTRLANAYQVAAKNDPFHILTGATDQAVQSQEMQKWMAQGLIQAGMPNTDAKLAELQHGNLNPDQLPETIGDLAPFFKASVQGAQEKLKYYNRVTNNGQDMSHEPMAAQQWLNYDPRWIEFDNLPPHSATNNQRGEFLIKHPDMIADQLKYKNLQQMGVVKGQGQ